MSSVVASPRSGPHLLPPAGPPPPPQPPPIPSVSPVSSPGSVSPNYRSYDRKSAKSPPPAPIVKPTTAGLLRFPSLPDSDGRVQILPQRSFSPQFKQELLAKQSALAPTNDVASIEEKIRQNKMINYRQYQYLAPNGVDHLQRHQYQQQQQQQVPEKLLSAMQKETKPFAYTVNVSDPNNRGKLDLSQIKSPIMRRRLLANMSSSEERDFENDDDDDDDDDDDHDEEHNNVYNQDYDDKEQAVIVRSETKVSPELSGSNLKTGSLSRGPSRNTQKTISFSPVVSFTYVDRDPMLIDGNMPNTSYTQVKQVQDDPRRPIIRYNEPPKFFTTQPSIASSKVDNNRALDRLDAEMAETLDDFERMLSDMSSTQQRQSSIRAVPFQFQSAQKAQRQNQPQSQWPASNINRHAKPDWSCQDQPARQQSTNCISCLHGGGLCGDGRTSRSWLRTFQA